MRRRREPGGGGIRAAVVLAAAFVAIEARAQDIDTADPAELSLERAVAIEREGFELKEADPEAAQGLYCVAARHFELLARDGGGARAYWRAARCNWLLGELEAP